MAQLIEGLRNACDFLREHLEPALEAVRARRDVRAAAASEAIAPAEGEA